MCRSRDCVSVQGPLSSEAHLDRRFALFCGPVFPCCISCLYGRHDSRVYVSRPGNRTPVSHHPNRTSSRLSTLPPAVRPGTEWVREGHA